MLTAPPSFWVRLTRVCTPQGFPIAGQAAIRRRDHSDGAKASSSKLPRSDRPPRQRVASAIVLIKANAAFGRATSNSAADVTTRTLARNAVEERCGDVNDERLDLRPRLSTIAHRTPKLGRSSERVRDAEREGCTDQRPEHGHQAWRVPA